MSNISTSLSQSSLIKLVLISEVHLLSHLILSLLILSYYHYYLILCIKLQYLLTDLCYSKFTNFKYCNTKMNSIIHLLHAIYFLIFLICKTLLPELFLLAFFWNNGTHLFHMANQHCTVISLHTTALYVMTIFPLQISLCLEYFLEGRRYFCKTVYF